MKKVKMGICVLCVVVALIVGYGAGRFLGLASARIEVLKGPYSDHYGPALAAIAEAKSKLAGKNKEAAACLDCAADHIEQSKEWAKGFLAK